MPTSEREVPLTMSNSDDHQQALQSERGAEVHFKEFLASYAEKKIWLQSSVKHSGNDVRSGRGGERETP